MTTKFYAKPDGSVVAFGDKAIPPFNYVEVPAPSHGLDTWNFETEQYDQYETPRTLNEQLETKMAELMVPHIGQAYFTDEVINKVGTTMTAVIEFNNRRNRTQCGMRLLRLVSWDYPYLLS